MCCCAEASGRTIVVYGNKSRLFIGAKENCFCRGGFHHAHNLSTYETIGVIEDLSVKSTFVPYVLSISLSSLVKVS